MAALRRRQGQLEAQARAADTRAEVLDVELRKKTAQAPIATTHLGSPI